MLKKLFSSKVRVLLLNQFLTNPGDEYYLRELASKFDVSPRQISIELQNLEGIELIKKRISGKQHYYSINIQHLIFNELHSIFMKTIGIKFVVKKYVESIKSDLKFVFIYGSVASRKSTIKSDVDLLLIGKISGRKLSSLMIEASEELNRVVNFHTISLDEFVSRLINNDHFLTTILQEPKIFILGNQSEFERLGKKWLVKKTSNEF